MRIVDEVKAQLERGESPQIHLTRDSIDVTPLREPDPEWEFVDKRGHRFFYDKNSEVGGLRWVEDFPATEEYPADGHWECMQCGELVEPGEKAPQFRTFAAGLVHCEINGHECSQNEYEEIVKLISKGEGAA